MVDLKTYFSLREEKPASIYRIAETAYNHEGSLPYMLQMIDALKLSGADAVKLHIMLELDAYMTVNHSLFARLQQWLFTREQWREVFERCRRNGLAIVGLADELPGLEFLIEEKVDVLAIHAASLHDAYMLRKLSRADQPLLVGVGGATLTDVEYTMRFLSPKKNIVFMYGIQQYPTPPSSLQLQKIPMYERLFNVPVGYADHTAAHAENERYLAYASAYGLGARVFEQHVTLDFDNKRIDDDSAIAAKSFVQFTEKTNLISLMCGSPVFELKEDEKKYVHSRKQMVAARDLPAGAIITEKDIQFRRTEQWSDMAPKDFEQLIGKTIKQQVAAGETFSRDHLDMEDSYE
ncbi:N-acetylneuraminate synthase family protein [Paenibacillus sp. N4]|uniref:N-acetylneuraminate synthase family protein n=1 Tax=Paenibacillus vietnamensis TaxID=2590547 RepID=UPI001CD15E87|nr:N-acetylneuraminate synthase family protein [Paenibacillus vietnamensis]MCA0754960.1 N-acetylneuraminate synthase family protein [Paenibacillus vietnamensis]